MLPKMEDDMRQRTVLGINKEPVNATFVKDVDHAASKEPEVIDHTAFGLDLMIVREVMGWRIKQESGKMSSKFDGLFTRHDLAVRAIEEYREERRA